MLALSTRRLGRAGGLTGLRKDGSGCDDNDGPVELLLEVGDDLLADFVVSVDGAVGDFNNKAFAVGSVLLFVLN